ncbi:Zinc finger protein 407 like protein [Argiope bruennichi]|uniref:Zinc finger protein 407 like protein n=1 Tax=Argiope bruennichi TaxID=94029 RepID=A0A8T0EXY5_ARGBR|nr:Zinc finger protein 407 like protein [Argiope bruennichi]
MDLGQDTHLCLRCGKTIDGLDNYVSHRLKKCLQPPSSSSFLPDSSSEPPVPFPPSESYVPLQSEAPPVSLKSMEPPVPLPPAEPPIPIPPAESPISFPSPPQDIYPRISANDFFLNLNLQYNAKASFVDVPGNDEKDSSSATDNFCSKLEIPSLENELSPVFSSDKPLLVEDNSCPDIDNITLRSDKWENFKINYRINESSHHLPKEKKICIDIGKQTSCSVPSASLKSKGALFADSSEISNKVSLKHSKKKTLKKYLFTNFSALNVPRTSYRQKLNANDRMLCCDGKQDYYSCSLCNHKYSFVSTFLDHLLICSKKQSDINSWKQEIFKNCHLKTPNHRQKTASLKNPLICLPCQDECSASDEMKEHFSKCHLRFKRGDHPIIITEKKRNLHCCYCLTLIKSSSHLQSSNIEDPLLKDDISFIRISLPNVCACACGVDKQMLSNFLTNTSPFITSKSSEVSKDLIEVDAETSNSSQSQKNELKDDEGTDNQSTNGDMLYENDLSLKAVRQRIIAKITSKDGKFIYKKVRVPDPKKEWSCCWCGVEYISKLTLQAHLNKCSLRKKKLNKVSPLKNNQNFQANHCSENKRYLCDKCPYIGKSFNQLTRHSRSHSGEKPYKCPHCTYSSSLSSQLVRHKRLHTGQKPYKCPYCLYTCNTQENLRKHILKTKKHKGKMMYPCQHCNYESNEFSDFKSHLMKAHSIEFPNGIASSDSSVHSDEIPGL